MLWLGLGSLEAQVVNGAIIGRVTDSQKAVVPGATILIENVDTGFSRTVLANEEGRYEARSLPLGSYSVTSQLEGFQKVVRKGITLSVGSEVVVDFELTPGAVEQLVEVTAEAPAIETTTATVSGLVNREQIAELPLNGRSYEQLALLSPGTLVNRSGLSVNGTGSPNSGYGARLSVNGGRPDANLTLLDGTNINNNSQNSNAGAAGLTLGAEAIREFRVLTHNYSAEYGRVAGAVVSTVTRSGTNEFHGSAYEYVRNNIFDARNFFNPGDLPAFRRNQFGAALGGPILRDRLFFFANYEGLRQVQGQTIIATVPDANARRGLVPNATTGQLQQVPLSPAIVPYLALYPLPNGRNFGDGTAQYVSDVSSPTTQNYSLGRVDFQMSDKDSFFGRYVHDPSENQLPEPVPTFLTANVATNHFFTLGETHIFSPAALNEFRFAFNRTDNTRTPLPTHVDPSLSFVPGADFGTIAFSGSGAAALGAQLANLGTNAVPPQRYLQNLFQESDTFSIIRGTHSLKFGADVERLQQNIVQGNNTRGMYSFGGLLSLLAAQPSQFAFTPLSGGSTNYLGWRRTLYGWFIQDDWRLSPKLTLNLGLRHEFFTAPTEVNGRSANLRNITDPESTLGPRFVPAKANFSPRLGLAWDPTGSGKTSIRLGAGVYYNQIDGSTYNSKLGARFTYMYSVQNPIFPDALSRGFSAQNQQEQTVEFHIPTPTIVQYGLEVQRQLTSSVSLRLGYVGSVGYHMLRVVDEDIRIPQRQPDGSLFFPANAPFVNPNFSSIAKLHADAHSNYNGLQTQLQKTVSQGLRFQVAYTFSKALSDADVSGNALSSNVPATTMNSLDLQQDYGRSGFDQRHTFVFNSGYQMPWDKRLNGRIVKALLGGWSTNGIFTAGSGLPMNIQVGFNNSRTLLSTTGGNDRPDLAPGASNNPIKGVTAGCQGIPAGQKLGTPDRWFDPCAFTLSPAGTFGNLGRQTVTGPSFYNVDFTLVKSTALAEKKQLEFRAEFFNLLNHANFALPNARVFTSTRLHSGNEGVITSTVAPNRQIQFGMKLTF